ncbi:CdaR family protein [Levilactobacillus bambusae]|uniref:Cell surface protein n=1 Tax=Levilactobacillus bambusae TaxID=2024736 RepID=A0A2V1MX63_9LACO|nr:CdaR family protein [Levilactobacillus bambusae]PWF99461.1 cell surface protein [Levilactobacillus bambusae]
MKKLMNSRWAYRLISLVLAILLFFYVNSMTPNHSNSLSGRQDRIATLSSTKTQTVSVPLQLNVNNDKYFVTGYPEYVKVTLSGSSALVTATANTQNFKVYASLSGLGKGTHTVTLHQEGLNSELRSTISPSQIKVNIQPRKTVNFPVKVKYNQGNIASGYKAGKATSDVTQVQATGAADQIAQIKQVAAVISLGPNVKKTQNKQAIIEALDAHDKTVNVILTPSTTTVNLPIASTGESKRVGLDLQAKNGDSKVKYALSSTTSSVTAYGSSQQLEALDKAEVDVDVSDVKEETTKTVTISPKQNDVKSFDPTSIKVKITPQS